MVIVEGRFVVDPAEREAFLADKEEGMRRALTEEGCAVYVFSAHPLEPDVVCLYERWETKDALLAHLGRMRSEPREPSGPAPKSATLTQHEISRSGPLGS